MRFAVINTLFGCADKGIDLTDRCLDDLEWAREELRISTGEAGLQGAILRQVSRHSRKIYQSVIGHVVLHKNSQYMNQVSANATNLSVESELLSPLISGHTSSALIELELVENTFFSIVWPFDDLVKLGLNFFLVLRERDAAFGSWTCNIKYRRLLDRAKNMKQNCKAKEIKANHKNKNSMIIW